MRRSTTLGSWARRDAVLVSALAAGAAIAALAAPLGLPWLMLAGAIVAALGAIPRLVIAMRRALLEGRVERAQLARLLRVDAMAITEVDPTLIGVDRAAEQGILPGGGLPRYVRRAADDELRDAVAAALDGTGAWLVVVHGPSKVGKSRSLFEALLACGRRTPLDVVAPVDALALKAISAPGGGLRPGSGATVLWLDDLEPFLDGGMTGQTLREWHAGGPARIVAATYGGKGNEMVAGSHTSRLATIAADLLGHAREIAIQATAPSELGTLRGALDESDYVALEHHGLAAYLVAGPALERKLNTGRHAPGEAACLEGVALVHAAVDWARCGRADPITTDALRELWPHYLPSQALVSDEVFERALNWATSPVAGSIGLMERGSGYRAFDYVVRLVRDRADGEPVHERAWGAALASAQDAQALAVATSAIVQGRADLALDAYARGRASSIHEVAALAAYNIGVVLAVQEQFAEAIAALDRVVIDFGAAADAATRRQVARAIIEKGALLIELGRFSEALSTYDAVIARFGDATEPGLRVEVAKATVEKGATLGDLDRPEDEVMIYAGVVARFSDSTDDAVRRQVARAMVNSGATLGELNRPEDELAVYDDVVALFGDSGDDELREQVAWALVSKGIRLSVLGHCAEALVVYDDVVARYGAASSYELCDQFATMLFNKGVTLEKLGRWGDAAAVYDDVVARFGDDPEPELSEVVELARAAREAADSHL